MRCPPRQPVERRQRVVDAAIWSLAGVGRAKSLRHCATQLANHPRAALSGCWPLPWGDLAMPTSGISRPCVWVYTSTRKAGCLRDYHTAQDVLPSEGRYQANRAVNTVLSGRRLLSGWPGGGCHAVANATQCSARSGLVALSGAARLPPGEPVWLADGLQEIGFEEVLMTYSWLKSEPKTYPGANGDRGS